MLSKALNERLTRVGRGTPGGELLRRYWHPIAPAVDVEKPGTKKVRILGEDLVLFRDRSGTLGLIDERCPHRRTSMAIGVPEANGLRCAYHGWLFDATGRCLEQPSEPEGSSYKSKVCTTAYRVEELGGLIFAYLGPEPAPLLPRYEFLVWDNVVRHVGTTVLPCNWLQSVENALDPTHVEWLHGRFMEYFWERLGKPLEVPYFRRRMRKFGFDRFSLGIMKRRLMEGEPDDAPGWLYGHNPYYFPTMSVAAYAYQYRVPVDDTHTYYLQYGVHRTGLPIESQKSVPSFEVNLPPDLTDEMMAVLLVQDFAAWASQGEIVDRENEHLGQSDVGVIMLRELLREQIDAVERGEDPIGVFRELPPGGVIPLPKDGDHPERRVAFSKQFESDWFEESLSPLRWQLRELHQEAERKRASGELVTPRNQGSFVPFGEHHRQVVMFATKGKELTAP
jgi:5,5'-dehydrodivanillate O-demethylase